jgi:hypothetical protein
MNTRIFTWKPSMMEREKTTRAQEICVYKRENNRKNFKLLKGKSLIGKPFSLYLVKLLLLVLVILML